MRWADGSEYFGELDYGVFHGKGRYNWHTENGDEMSRGHWYEGDWVNGKMDGQGEFHHREGHVLKPNFKCNQFFMNDGGASIIPFKTQKEID
jgi:hypothetical protein